jgi:hypothetical protein
MEAYALSSFNTAKGPYRGKSTDSFKSQRRQSNQSGLTLLSVRGKCHSSGKKSEEVYELEGLHLF